MEKKDKKFTIRPEGTMNIRTLPDGSVHSSSDKPVSIDLGHIDSIGVRNIIDIESHTITRVAGMISHHVRFYDGGGIVLAFNGRGEIIECKGTEVQTTINHGRELMFSKKNNLVPRKNHRTVHCFSRTLSSWPATV